MGCPMLIMVYITAVQCLVRFPRKKYVFHKKNSNKSNCLTAQQQEKVQKNLLKKHHFKQRGIEEYVPISLKSLL